MTGYNMVLTPGKPTFHVGTWSDSVEEKPHGDPGF